MPPLLLLPPPISFIIKTLIIFLSLFFFTKYATCDDEEYKACEPFSCGNINNISYPFWTQSSYCGHPKFKLDCQQPNNYTVIEINSQKFHIIDMNQESNLLNIARLDLLNGGYDQYSSSCPKEYINVSLDFDFFNYTSNDENHTLFYGCSSQDSYSNGYGVVSTCLMDFDGRCKSKITVPVLKSSLEENLGVVNILDEGFEVMWSIGVDGEKCDICIESGGRCGYNTSGNAFMCLCLDGKDEVYCKKLKSRDTLIQSPLPAQSYNGYGSSPNGESPTSLPSIPLQLSPPPLPHLEESHDHAKSNPFNWKRKIVIGVGSAVALTLLICIIIYCFRRKISKRQVRLQLTTKNDKDIEAFLKNHGALSQKIYTFSEVKKMTNSFQVKLGEGGFGAVYKGELLNGFPVAVKMLKASKGNGEEFINEVASISRTSHVNVVSLLGFCFEGCKKALIYEFMAKGSLDNFIYNRGSETIASLRLDNLYQIAKGIARGLEYLHRGCNTRILHFDIKPHNILLDENFCPKISDFGLAKLCPKKESIISMSDARGTMGYVAPEVWNRQFGGVSHKSDVYSYGMMLLEMVGGRKNINAEASHTSEIYYPYWVYTRLQLGSDLRPDGVIVTEEDEIARRMTIVGLWCIQTFPNDRPTMSKVIEMLEGNMNSLEIPPKPMFSSPTRSE